MTEQIGNKPVQLAANTIANQVQDKLQAASDFEVFMTDQPKAESASQDHKNNVQKGTESVAAYMRQIQEISSGQQF